MKFRLISQVIVKNSYTKFYRNLTNVLVADTRSWKDGHTDIACTYGIHFTSYTSKGCTWPGEFYDGATSGQ